MTSETVEDIHVPPEALRAEIARLDRRVAGLEAERRRYAHGSGPLTLDEFLEPVRLSRRAWDLRRAGGEPQGKVVKVVRPSA
ncbi:capsule biosynthesis protein CapZ, partial [Streptomyces uncialis]